MDEPLFPSVITKNVKSHCFSPLETQQQILNFFSKGWWMFLLGQPNSMPGLVQDLMKRHYPGDSRDWVIEWQIQVHVEPAMALTVVALSPKYMTRGNILAELAKRSGWVTDPDYDHKPMEDDGSAQIFVPMTGFDGASTPEKMEEITRQAGLLQMHFNRFIHANFPLPPQPRPANDAPVSIPQMIAVHPEDPKMITITPWIDTGNPYSPATRLIGWYLSDALSFSYVISLEVLTHDNLVETRLMSRTALSPITEADVEAGKKTLIEDIAKIIALIETERDAVLRKRSPHAPQATPAHPPSDQRPQRGAHEDRSGEAAGGPA